MQGSAAGGARLHALPVAPTPECILCMPTVGIKSMAWSHAVFGAAPELLAC